MTNSIKSIDIWNPRLDSTLADVTISVTPEQVHSVTQVRGKLVGPQCRYASTVEVAYPLRETSREYASTGIPGIVCKAVIPEPSLWDPISPFLYKGQVELWENGQQCEALQITHCLRELLLGRSGLRINGASLLLKGKRLSGRVSDAEAISMHQQQINALLVNVNDSTPVLWDMADRLGFVILTRIANEQELKIAVSRRQEIRNRSFCLGWIVSQQAVQNELALIAARTLPDSHSAPLLGLEVTQAPSGPVPEGFSFFACEEHIAPSLAEIELPTLLLGGNENARQSLAAKLGWIQ